MCSVNEVVVVVLHAILSKAILQSLGKFVNLPLGFLKRVAIVSTVLFAFLCLEESVTDSRNALGSCTS